jgi:imidazolonepropionase-like amidohydrolase
VEAKPLNEQVVLRAGVPIMLNSGGFVISEDSLKTITAAGHTPPGAEWTLLGKSHFNALLGAQDIGMKPMHALQGVTRNIARAYKVDKDLGTLEPGKFADLLILDRNPLQNAENYNSISVVMKEGKVVDHHALPTQKLLTRASE